METYLTMLSVAVAHAEGLIEEEDVRLAPVSTNHETAHRPV